MTRPAPLCGLLNLDKPIGMTSREAVDRVARPLKRAKLGAKVGHAGTLDPLATGVLIVAVGAATRLIEHVQRSPKSYRAVVRLGAVSDTLDADGTITETPDPRVPTADEVREALAAQVGTIEQVPPSFSALRVGGQRSYDLARAGRAVELAARPVRIDRVELLRYDWPELEIAVDCGSGTYIRSVARDVGAALGVGGLIAVLRRTRIGPFTEADAIAPDPERLTAETIPGLLRPALEAVADLPRLALTAEQAADVAQGKPLGRPAGVEPPSAGELALIGPDGALLAIAEGDPAAGLVRPKKVLKG